MGKVKKNLGLGYLIAAAFFLFNPNIVIIDFIPDFIGYILLITGISQLSDLNHHMEEACKLFKRMFIVSLAQFFSIFFVFGVLPSREIASSLMLVCFAFGALELILLIPAFKSLFEGFIYLGSRHDSTAIFKRKKSKMKKPLSISEKSLRKLSAKNPKRLEKLQKKLARKNAKRTKERFGMTATAKATLFTIIFVIAKPVFTFAPEILELFDSRVNPNLTVNFYRYIDSFRLVSWIFLLPIGIVWLITFIRYVKSIIKDSPFINELSEKYTSEISPKTFLFTQRYIKLAFIILAVALAFNVDFYVDHASILPDFISPIILMIMLFIVRKFGKVPIKSYIFSVGYMLTSLTTYILNIRFYSNHTLSMTFLYPEAYNKFLALAICKSLDSALFVCMILSLLPILSKIIMENTGFMPIGTANYNVQDKIKYIHTMLNKKLTVITVLAILAGISSICYVIFLRSFDYIWLVEFVVYIVFAVYFVRTLNSIREEMEYKYMLS